MTETPAERIERKKREEELRQKSQRKERLWRSFLAHAIGIIYIWAELNLGYKPDLRDRN